MEYNKINKNAIKSWYIGRIIFLLIFSIIYGLLIYKLIIPNFVHVAILEYGLNILTILIGIFLLINTFIFPIIEYKEWKYIISNDKIELINGIFIRKRIIIPISRVQHLDIVQGPIYRKFGLATLRLNTAGSIHEIPALTNKEAEIISETLKNQIEKSGKVE